MVISAIFFRAGIKQQLARAHHIGGQLGHGRRVVNAFALPLQQPPGLLTDFFILGLLLLQRGKKLLILRFGQHVLQPRNAHVSGFVDILQQFFLRHHVNITSPVGWREEENFILRRAG